MERREFLTRCGSAAALLTLAGCGVGGTRAVDTSTTTATGSTTTGPPRPPDYAALARSLSGHLVQPGDPSYATDKVLYNERFDNLSPAAIAYCATPTDVQRCIAFARRSGLPMTARSGGHSYGGYSSGGGLVIDVSPLSRVSIDPSSSTATVGAGVPLLALYQQVGQQGVLVPGGSCPTVGVAGLALGGGIGVLGRRYGLTCDNIASLQVVTADARIVRAGPDENADLYWACRGGGGGNFGVVTSFTFGTHPIPPITLFTLVWPWAAATDVLGAWPSWVTGTPDELWSNCQLLSAGASGLSLRVTGVFAGSVTACSAALAPLLSAVASAPSYQFVGPESYERAMFIEAGCENETEAQCLQASRAAFAAKSAFLDAVLPAAGVASVVSAVESLSTDLPALGGGFVFDSWGGAIGRVAPGATAFAHRSALCGVQYSVNWGAGAPSSVTAGAEDWLTSTQTAVAPYVTGAYLNYIDPTQPDWLHAYYGDNLPRLVSVKRAVDPDDVFRFAQSVPTRLP